MLDADIHFLLQIKTTTGRKILKKDELHIGFYDIFLLFIELDSRSKC